MEASRARTWVHKAHSKYAWALEAALADRSAPVTRLSQLPSYRFRPVSRPHVRPPLQSLFRVERDSAVTDDDRVCVWITARGPFEFLDAKDALTLAAQRAGVADVLPLSVVWPWDAHKDDGIAACASAVNAGLGSPIAPADALVIKPACGSRGDGIAYVASPHAALYLLRRHAEAAEMAEREMGFLTRLRAEHGGRIPGWVLQQRIVPFGGPSHPAQLRAHVAYVRRRGSGSGSLHIFAEHEVRRVGFGGRKLQFDTTASATCTAGTIDPAGDAGDVVAEESGEDTTAGIGSVSHPYQMHNEFRERGETVRMLVDDWPELATALGGTGAPRMTKLIERLLRGLHDAGELEAAIGFARTSRLRDRRARQERDLGRECKSRARTELADESDEDMHAHTAALAAIDMILSEDCRKLAILEINHRPALPQPGAHTLTPAFSAHVVRLVGSLFDLTRGSGHGAKLWCEIEGIKTS